MALQSKSGLRDATGDGAGGPDLKSMTINSSETGGGGGPVQHTITVCFEGDCPPSGSETIVHLGDADVKIKSEGSTSAQVAKKPKGASSYNPYQIANWDCHDGLCCITFTCTEPEMNNPGGTGSGPKGFDFSAECPGGDKMPDTGSGTHGW